MARKKMNLTEEKIQALVRAGRGQGEGAEYIPWLQIGDFSSQGRSHRIQDPENGRSHHLFSDKFRLLGRLEAIEEVSKTILYILVFI